MLRTLSVTIDRFDLRRPLRISRGTKTAAEVVTVNIGQDRALGHGEGVPYARYGKSPQMSVGVIEAARDAKMVRSLSLADCLRPSWR